SSVLLGRVCQPPPIGRKPCVLFVEWRLHKCRRHSAESGFDPQTSAALLKQNKAAVRRPIERSLRAIGQRESGPGAVAVLPVEPVCCGIAEGKASAIRRPHRTRSPSKRQAPQRTSSKIDKPDLSDI